MISYLGRVLRILGVLVDRKMNWTDHIKERVAKGTAAFDAVSRLTASTWGISTRKAKLLYTAIVRPTISCATTNYGKPERQLGANLTKSKAS